MSPLSSLLRSARTSPPAAATSDDIVDELRTEPIPDLADHEGYWRDERAAARRELFRRLEVRSATPGRIGFAAQPLIRSVVFRQDRLAVACSDFPNAPGPAAYTFGPGMARVLVERATVETGGA